MRRTIPDTQLFATCILIGMEPSILHNILKHYAPPSPLDDTGLFIHQAPDLFALWSGLEEETGTIYPPPFWGIVWPANRMLAQYITLNPSLFKGKTVLDIGCGGGAASVASAMCGATMVCANDIDPDACMVAQKNAALNRIVFTTDSTDCLTQTDPPFYDIILIADMFYEASVAERFFSFLYTQHERGSQVLISDANRPFTPRNKLRSLSAATYRADPDVDGVASRTVTLYEIP